MFLQNTLIAQDKMPQILQHFQADKGSLERFYVIDMSPEKRGRMISFYKEYLSKIKDLSFKSLSQSDKVDYLLFKNQLDANLNDLNIEEANYQSSKKWIDFASIIYTQEQSRRRGANIDAEKTALTWNKLSKEIQQSHRLCILLEPSEDTKKL
jgi:uncharacterized protein (DUF885 family)